MTAPAAIADDDPRIIEVMLLRWGENHASGKTVTFQLPPEAEPHPFRGMKCGPTNGQRLKLFAVMVDDDETEQPMQAEADLPDAEDVRGILKPGAAAREAAEQELRPLKSAADPHHHSRQAAMLCGQSLFHAFLRDNFRDRWETAWKENANFGTSAAQTVRYLCGVQSRAEFDSDPEAAKRWRALAAEFDVWRGRA